jgi:hypothetical protein
VKRQTVSNEMFVVNCESERSEVSLESEQTVKPNCGRTNLKAKLIECNQGSLKKVEECEYAIVTTSCGVWQSD